MKGELPGKHLKKRLYLGLRLLSKRRKKVPVGGDYKKGGGQSAAGKKKKKITDCITYRKDPDVETKRDQKEQEGRRKLTEIGKRWKLLIATRPAQRRVGRKEKNGQHGLGGGQKSFGPCGAFASRRPATGKKRKTGGKNPGKQEIYCPKLGVWTAQSSARRLEKNQKEKPKNRKVY